jgi:8-oxo-dGTP pyrophosphatase MutT (NUDIX family)
MIKIHSGDKIVFLTTTNNLPSPQFNSITIKVSSSHEMEEFYSVLMKHKEIDNIYFYNENRSDLFDWFKSMFILVEAAGGLVKNKNGEYLFILRHGKWDLPKGKIEKGESIEEAAIREVEEECGISGLTIIKKMEPTFHTYFLHEKSILKPTYWFEMDCSDTSTLVPQAEEGITEVRWIAAEGLEMVRKNTYESIKDVIAEL